MLRWFGRAVLSQKMRNVGTPTKAAVNVPARKSSVLRFSELQVGSTVCRVYWEKQVLDFLKQTFAKPQETVNSCAPFAVLDVIGATRYGHKTGTRWYYKCCTRVDEETRFTLHPDYKPRVLRTTKEVS